MQVDFDDMYQSHPPEDLHPDKSLEAGLILPRFLERDFPSDLIGTPIEDIDKYYERAGIPVSKCNQLNDIQIVICICDVSEYD